MTSSTSSVLVSTTSFCNFLDYFLGNDLTSSVTTLTVNLDLLGYYLGNWNFDLLGYYPSNLNCSVPQATAANHSHDGQETIARGMNLTF